MVGLIHESTLPVGDASAVPKPRSALVFRWDAYRQLLIYL